MIWKKKKKEIGAYDISSFLCLNARKTKMPSGKKNMKLFPTSIRVTTSLKVWREEKKRYLLTIKKRNCLRYYVFSQEAAVTQQSGPQLDSHNAEDKKDKEAEKEHIS